MKPSDLVKLSLTMLLGMVINYISSYLCAISVIDRYISLQNVCQFNDSAHPI